MPAIFLSGDNLYENPYNCEKSYSDLSSSHSGDCVWKNVRVHSCSMGVFGSGGSNVPGAGHARMDGGCIGKGVVGVAVILAYGGSFFHLEPIRRDVIASCTNGCAEVRFFINVIICLSRTQWSIGGIASPPTSVDA